MKLSKLLFGMALVACLISARAQASSYFIQELDGAIIIAADGHFLGVITTSRIDSKSILNQLGDYGSALSGDSIFNKLGDYGNELSEYSPFNQLSLTPPKIYTKDQKWAYLTVNSSLNPRVDPYWLIGMLQANQ